MDGRRVASSALCGSFGTVIVTGGKCTNTCTSRTASSDKASTNRSCGEVMTRMSGVRSEGQAEGVQHRGRREHREAVRLLHPELLRLGRLLVLQLADMVLVLD